MTTLPYEAEARRLYEIEYAITPGESSKWPDWKDLTVNERAAWRKYAERETTKPRAPVWPNEPIRTRAT